MTIVMNAHYKTYQTTHSYTYQNTPNYDMKRLLFVTSISNIMKNDTYYNMHRREQIISLIKAISHAIMNVHTKIVPLPHEEMYNCFVMKIVNLLIATR